MSQIPRLKSLDSTIALAADPYRFISSNCRRLGSDRFRTRLLFQPAICMTGPASAELFYDTSRFQRAGAPPTRVERSLFGKGGVQGLDDEDHRHRKRLFMSLMSPEGIRWIGELSREAWRRHVSAWAGSAAPLPLYPAFQEKLTRVVCRWAGVPLVESEVALRSRDLTAMFDAAGTVGPRHWMARVARRRSEAWIENLVRAARNGAGTSLETDSPFVAIARHRDRSGMPIPARIAAVEVLNVLRPTVAVAVYLVFVAHALHAHPESRDRIRDGDEEHLGRFVQEVRRHYPFFPAVVARTRHEFTWTGHDFPAGTRTLLDLYGINHDPRVWRDPDRFDPDRFAAADPGPFGLVPQGGGDPHVGHRCPGEAIAIELMKVGAGFLAGGMRYDVPDQDLDINFRRLPAMVRSGFRIGNVRLA